MLGKENICGLLTMTRVPNETQLKISCPFYHRLMEVPKALRLGVLEASIQAAMIAKGHWYLTFPMSVGLLSGLMTL